MSTVPNVERNTGESGGCLDSAALIPVHENGEPTPLDMRIGEVLKIHFYSLEPPGQDREALIRAARSLNRRTKLS